MFEILDEDGPAPPGQPGRIVVTQLHNDAMPLVRYELGDLAVAAPPGAVCTCGRTLPMLERLEGRVPDLISVPDGNLPGTALLCRVVQGFAEASFATRSCSSHPGRMLVRLVGREGCKPSEVEEMVRREVAAATRDLLAVEFDWTGDIPLSGAGKRRLVVSDVTREKLQTARRDHATSPEGLPGHS